ncbi:MAG: GNAT family N-acetyltransferase [Candidatus Accumulibacter sp.]|jgi:GNAT superfamily N-acetyltransferase|nr:GNAT family N-acetyltransferase [Accumulibacter sp.]
MSGVVHAPESTRINLLAVDGRYQGRGIGQDLLAFALRLAVDFSARIGLYAVVIDAQDDKNKKAAGICRRLGFLPTLDDPRCLFLPLSALKQTAGER